MKNELPDMGLMLSISVREEGEYEIRISKGVPLEKERYGINVKGRLTEIQNGIHACFNRVLVEYLHENRDMLPEDLQSDVRDILKIIKKNEGQS